MSFVIKNTLTSGMRPRRRLRLRLSRQRCVYPTFIMCCWSLALGIFLFLLQSVNCKHYDIYERSYISTYVYTYVMNVQFIVIWMYICMYKNIVIKFVYEICEECVILYCKEVISYLCTYIYCILVHYSH